VLHAHESSVGSVMHYFFYEVATFHFGLVVWLNLSHEMHPSSGDLAKSVKKNEANLGGN
jgi:hypothetical protein